MSVCHEEQEPPGNTKLVLESGWWKLLRNLTAAILFVDKQIALAVIAL